MREVKPGRAGLVGWRFACVAAGLFALYLVLPERVMGYLVAERLAPLAAMLGVLCLPPPPRRVFVAKSLAGGVLVVHLGFAIPEAAAFERDAAGLAELLEHAEPGRTLAGLVYEPLPGTFRRPVPPALPDLQPLPRLLPSPPRRPRPLFLRRAVPLGRPIPPRPPLAPRPPGPRRRPQPPRLLPPPRRPLFDYLLARGDWPEIQAALGPALADWQLRSAGRWHLLRER